MAMYQLHLYHDRDVTRKIESIDVDMLPEAGDRLLQKYVVKDVRMAEVASERNVVVQDYVPPSPPQPPIRQRPGGYVRRTNW